MSKELITFLTKLSTDPKVAEAFKTDPKSTMKEHDLSEEHMKLIMEKDYEGIKKVLGKDYEEFSINGIVKSLKD